MSWAARALAWLALSAGDYDSAEQYAQEGFALSQSLRSTDGIARSAFTLGWVALAQGDFEAAVPYQEMSLSIWQRLGFDHADIDTRLALGLAHMHSGRLQEAQEIADLCRVRADERHREEGVVYSRLLSGMVSLALEQPLRALKELRAIENSVAGDRLAIQAYFCATLARLAVDPSAAAEALADVEAHVDQGISYPLMTARLKVVKAATSAAQGHESAARQLWTEACGQPLIARSQWYAMVIKLVSPALALLT